MQFLCDTATDKAECCWTIHMTELQLSRVSKIVDRLIFYNLKKLEPVFMTFGTLYAEGCSF